MKLFLLFFSFVSFSHSSNSELELLDQCIIKLKDKRKNISESTFFGKILPLDRRLFFLVSSIPVAEKNAENIKRLIASNSGDTYTPYLLTNATTACEKDLIQLDGYTGKLKVFLLFFFLTSLSVSIYSAYILFKVVL